MLVRLRDTNVIPTGAIRILPIITYLPILVVIVCIYCYIAAVNKNEVKPFPNCTISATAEGYPQDIAFRTIMTPAMVYFIMMIRIIYLMLTGLMARYRLRANVPCEIWYFGLIGSLLYGIAMATIANGQMAGGLHGASAVIFFILFIVDLVLIDRQLTKLQAVDPSVISTKSLRLKRAITWVILLTVVFELIHLIIGETFGVYLLHEPVPTLNGASRFDVVYGTAAEICVIEWVAVYGFAVYFYTFREEWKNYAFVLTINAAKVADRAIPQQQQQYDVIAPLFTTVRQPLVAAA